MNPPCCHNCRFLTSAAAGAAGIIDPLPGSNTWIDGSPDGRFFQMTARATSRWPSRPSDLLFPGRRMLYTAPRSSRYVKEAAHFAVAEQPCTVGRGGAGSAGSRLAGGIEDRGVEASTSIEAGALPVKEVHSALHDVFETGAEPWMLIFKDGTRVGDGRGVPSWRLTPSSPERAKSYLSAAAGAAVHCTYRGNRGGFLPVRSGWKHRSG